MKPNPEKFVCFMTGASGAGKSTLAGHLKSKYANRKDIAILGFDAIGVPSNEEMVEDYGSPSEWQRTATKQWVAKIINEVEEPIVILEGQVNFDFIREAFDHHKFTNFKAILIDCDEEEMVRRLEQDRGQPELANEDMKNWRAHLRKQAEEYDAPVINTAGMSEEEVMQKLDAVLGKILN